MDGVRARLTWTGSADGSVAPTFVTFFLRPWDLPEDKHPSGIVVLPITGLAAGGVNPDCDTVGYVVFVRQGTPEVETENFKHYRKEIFGPYVKKKRDLPEGVAPSDEDFSVSWKDGGDSQLKAVTQLMGAEDPSESDSMLIDNKHSASRSAREQPMDLTVIFKMCNDILAKLGRK